MRLARLGLVATAVAVGLIIPSSASAQVGSVSVGSVTLGPGTSLTVRLDIVCEPGWNIAVAHGPFVRQDHKDGGVSFGYGTTEADFPGIPCTGARQAFLATVDLQSPATPFKKGRARVEGGSVSFYLADTPPPGIFEFVSFAFEDVKIKKK